MHFGIDTALYDIESKKNKVSLSKFLSPAAYNKIKFSSLYSKQSKKVEYHTKTIKYKLGVQSIDEDIVSKNIYQWIRDPENRPDAILYVVDVNNIRRNLYFCTQLLELNIPTVVLLNMYCHYH